MRKMGSKIINSMIHRKLSKMRVLLVIDANSLNVIAKNILLKNAHALTWQEIFCRDRQNKTTNCKEAMSPLTQPLAILFI